MLNKPRECIGCSLFMAPNSGFSMPEGKCTNGVLIVGEALGQKEKMAGLPLRPDAESGSVLQTVFRRLQVDRSDFLLWNLVACQPPNNLLENMPYEREAIMHCRVHFQKVLENNIGKVKCVLALGNLPLRYLCPEIEELYNAAKADKNKKQLKKLGSTSLRGYAFNSILGIPIVSTIHPSFIARGERLLLHVLKRDVYFAMQVAQNGIPKFQTDYIVDPTDEEVNNFYNYCRNNKNLAISYDIETPYTSIETDETEIEYENVDIRNIDSIQFSVESGKGIFLDWNKHNEAAASILRLPNTKLGWNNWKFDETNLEYHLGKGCINGENQDLMWMWKHANPDFVKVGRALQFATNFFASDFPAWKHRSESDPKNYGCLDVDAVVRINNGLSYALKNKRFLPNTKSLYEGYIDDIVNLRPILKDMTDRGLPIDVEAREEMRLMLIKEIRKANRELQELYPFELRNPQPKLGYKYVPKEIDELTNKFNDKFRKISSNGHKSDYTIFGDSDTYNLYLSRFIEQNSRIRVSKKRDGSVIEKPIETTGLICKEFLIDGIKEKRWCRVEKFKAGSREQVIAYIKYKGYKVPTTKDFRKGNKDTTTKDVISALADEHGDKIFNLIVYLRELRKLKSTYVDSKRKGWILGRDNRIHADFLPIPATGQLSSKIHNAPARGTRFSSEGYKQLANQFRKTIAAGLGKLLLSGDWSSFHALTLGFEAEDQEYCVAPNTRILTEDFTWKIADEIVVGDRLIGFDEFSEREHTKRTLKPAIVEQVIKWQLPCMEITTDKGTIVCSIDHKWLAKYSDTAHPRWFKTNELKIGNRICKFIDPWESINSYEEGYVAGILDGEGTINKNSVSFAQNDGLVLDKTISILEADGFQLSKTSVDGKCNRISITGNFAGLRAVGKYRPVRLLAKAKEQYVGTATHGKHSKNAIILDIKFIGIRDVVCIATSTNTYIAEGLLSHNCRLVRLDVHSYVAAYILASELPDRHKKLKWKKPDKLSNEEWIAKCAKYEECLNRISNLENWLSLPDDQLKEQLKWIKKNFEFTRNSQAKPAILGMGFGMREHKFYKLNRHSFKDIKSCENLINTIRKLFPLTFDKFHRDILERADRDEYLISRYGYIRWFNDVYDWRMITGPPKTIRHGERLVRNKGRLYHVKLGNDSNKCIAFLPANDAFGKKKEAIRDLWEYEKDGIIENKIKDFCLINEIHDDLLFEVEESKIQEAAKVVREVMMRPAKYLKNSIAPDGLIVGVEMKCGKNWAEMEELKI